MEKVFKIIDEAGLHARPATILVKTASDFEADVTLVYNGNSVNLKSIMGVMSLGVQHGEEVTVTAEGADAQAAVEAIATTMKEQGLAN